MTEFWNVQGNEKSDTQVFWIALIRKVFGIIKPEEYIEFEKRVKDGHTKLIDAYVKSTGIIIEQKSKGKNLDDAFAQAKNYYVETISKDVFAHIIRNPFAFCEFTHD